MNHPTFRLLLVLLPALGLLPPAVAQTPVPLPVREDEAVRLRKELEAGRDLEMRRTAIRGLSSRDSLPAAKLLLEGLTNSLNRIEALDLQRKENDEKITKILAGQIVGGAKRMPDYQGVEELQTLQKAYGQQLTDEEAAVRSYVEAFGTFKNQECIDFIERANPKKPARVRPLMLEALGGIDDGRVAEYLLGLLSDSNGEVRLAAAASLLKQRLEFVPGGAWAPLLRSPDWRERSFAIDALARTGGRGAMDLLIEQTGKETGKQLADLCDHLSEITHEKFGKAPQAWVDWWRKNREHFEPKGLELTRPMREKRTGNYQFLSIQFDSLRVIYVIDISGSMLAAIDDHENIDPDPGKARIDLVRREVKGSISSLPLNASFNVIAYNDIVLPWKPKLVPATIENRKLVFEWLDGLAASGQTNISDALEKAFEQVPGTVKGPGYDNTADTILFMSDGAPTCGKILDCDQILAQVRDWNRTRHASIYAVGIGKQTVQKFLKALAKQNNGESAFIEH